MKDIFKVSMILLTISAIILIVELGWVIVPFVAAGVVSLYLAYKK